MSNEVTLTINGQSVSVPAGTTIIQAAQKLGVHVPHFCWHPGLSIAGVCRFCMVKIEGNPKLQIACNTPVGEGMKVDTVNEEVKDAHKWALEFHLINHPLDCPICDQAGECELQNYYMKVGRYDSQMDEQKVLKPKALDVGTTLVLDTERCILCSRCVRFEDEVTKTSTLGIFNRGDVAVIGTYKDRRITHNYSYNIADICPVGAFTAKDFRFKCRVWFLSETKTVCPGCSTGCNVTLFQNKNQRDYYRLKPRFNEQVNGHWMCDYGRSMYEHLNAGARLSQPLLGGASTSWDVASASLAAELKAAGSQGTAVVLTPQETVEDYEALLSGLEGLLGALPAITVWRPTGETPEAFDGILFRGDRNPNTKGLAEVLEKRGVSAVTQQGSQLSPRAKSGDVPQLTLVFGPEVEKAYEGFEGDLRRLAQLAQSKSGTKVCYIGVSLSAAANSFWMRLPSKTFAEKGGTYVNAQGVRQRLKANAPVMPHVRGIADILKGLALPPQKVSAPSVSLSV
jgi:NADH-quinone oxidoreductase subunit G